MKIITVINDMYTVFIMILTQYIKCVQKFVDPRGNEFIARRLQDPHTHRTGAAAYLLVIFSAASADSPTGHDR